MEKMPPKELPYTTKSICPECFCVIEATVYEEDGNVMMKKECKEHGEYKETYWSSASEFHRAFKYAYKGIGLDNPRTETINQCP
ncbi:MAG: tetraether lipid synthase Tes, partial [Candidatus Hermodarchaeia archaeon]